MSVDLKYNKGKIAAGAAMVALSGFVPQPLMNAAEAATVNVVVTGSFITGVSLVAGNDVKFGKLIATNTGGNIAFATTATGAVDTVLTAGVNVAKISGQQVGTFKMKLVATGVKVDATASNLGQVTALGATVGGAPAAGTAGLKIDKLLLGAANLATTGTALVFSSGGGTKATITDAFKVGVATQQVITVGASILWGATQPVGAFSQAITLTVAY